jgi:hypothetical protein
VVCVSLREKFFKMGRTCRERVGRRTRGRRIWGVFVFGDAIFWIFGVKETGGWAQSALVRG